MATATTPIHKVGLDLGNGYVKAIVDNEIYIYPSVAAKQFNTANSIPVTLDEVPGFMRDVVNQMDLSFSSPLVNSTERRLFGDRALKSGLTIEEFDLFARAGKSAVDLSGVLVLGTVAADYLSRYYKKNNTLPTETLHVKIDLASALPISEHKVHAKNYRERYLNNGQPHLVTFHNFESMIRVEIVFDYVLIMNEGESAQYSLKYANDAFTNVVYQEALKHYPNGELEGITGNDLVAAENSLGIDIGEGTIDWAVFTNGKFNPDISNTFPQGYGTVLESTLTTLQSQGHPYRSRKELSEFLHSSPSPMALKKWNHVKNVNVAEEQRFAAVISGEMNKVLSRVGGFTEVIFVFGGGASPLEHALMDHLKARVTDFGADNLLPIVYLNSNYSRLLNAQGLFQAAKLLRPTA